MQKLAELWRRVLFLLRRGRLDREMTEEMRFHLEMKIEEKIDRGLTPEEAVSAARREFGNQTLLREESREVWGFNMIETLFWDVRYATRVLLKSPGFTSVAILTLALGVGANTAVFSVVNAVLLRPLPYPHPERMVYLFGSSLSDPKTEDSLSPHNFTDVRTRNHSFDAYCALNYGSFTLTGGDRPEALSGVMASADFARVAGTEPAIGRYFTAEEDTPGKNRVALISDGLWRRRFGADAQAVGREVQLNGEPYTIVGVMPPDFNFPAAGVEVWTPLALDLSKYQRGTSFLDTAGRLKPGVTVEQARADVQTIAAQLRTEIPNFNPDFGIKVVTVRDHALGEIERPLLILFGAVVMVLLIACANISNLVLGRSAARWREIGLRSALGASRLRVVRLLLAESVLLSLAGGGAGLLLALYGVDVLTAINPAVLPRGGKIAVDGYVIAFTFFVSLLTGILFGLAPAWQATKTDLNRALRESSRSATGGRRLKFVRGGLVVAEISLSLVLLVGAGLLLESFWKLLQVDPGFRAENVLTCLVDLPRAKYPEDRRRADFFRSALERVRTLPGVESVGFGTSLPFGGSRGMSSFTIDDHPTSRDDPNAPSADRHQVAPGYFKTMGIPLRGGRDFTDADDISHPGVVIINEAAAMRFWPGENPLGKRLTIGMPQEVALYGKPVSREIVGVVGNVKHEELNAEFQPEMYIPAYQLPPNGMTLAVRGSVPADELTEGVRRAVQSVDSDQPIRRVQLLGDAVARSVAPLRFLAALLLLFAAVALVLAAVGTYGVMSYAVAQRTHEIGIRMALGAQRGSVLRLVIGQGMALTLAGVAVGLAASLALSRVLTSLLYGVGANDLKTFAGLSLLIACVAFVACLVPARRATKIDPMVALKYE